MGRAIPIVILIFAALATTAAAATPPPAKYRFTGWTAAPGGPPTHYVVYNGVVVTRFSDPWGETWQQPVSFTVCVSNVVHSTKRCRKATMMSRVAALTFDPFAINGTTQGRHKMLAEWWVRGQRVAAWPFIFEWSGQ